MTGLLLALFTFSSLRINIFTGPRILSEAPTLLTMEEAGETLLSKEEMEASGLEPDQVRNIIVRSLSFQKCSVLSLGFSFEEML